MNFLSRQSGPKTKIYGLDSVVENDGILTSAPELPDKGRSHAIYDLNQTARRLRQYESEADWVSAVVDGSSRFLRQAALFAIEGDTLRLRGKQDLDVPSDLAFPFSAGRAFASAIKSKDPVIALRTPAEVSEFLASGAATERAHVIPILNGERVVALLFALGDANIDLNALELVAGMASMALERRSNSERNVQVAPALKPGNPERSPRRTPAKLLPWASLSEDQRTLHIRAQRFSRVKAAEIQLSRPEACRAGLEQNNVYLFLKKEIDAVRDSYRKQFLTIPSMIDYFHLELVRTTGEGDESKLGADYPGQLV